NSKSGEVCRVIHVEQGPDGEPIRYNFEYLAEALLPVARWDIEADRKARADRRQFKLLPGGQTGNLRTLNGRQLAWDRLEDLRTL
ncbi:replication protein, partial [Escherichia coli]|nr:replication protein [Escherichia coli]